MRIDVDATSLLLRSAGVKNYVYYWTRSLAAAMPDHDIRAFPFLGRISDLDHERSMLGFLPTYTRLGLLYFLNVPGNPAINLVAHGADIFHASNQVRVPPTNVMLTATLYDMTCLLMPERHTAANVRAEQNFADKVLKRAAGLIAISEHTRNDALRLLNLPPDRIRVIYPGVPDAYFAVSEQDKARVRELYRLTRPYVLFVGTIEPRKNVDVLLDAWSALPADVRGEFELILAGPIGWAESSTVDRVRSSGEARHVGYIPEGDLPGLTASATAFVYPSLYEGFGFPPAQAMAAGVPVITSNVSSLPEVAGPAGLLVDPRSAADLSTALRDMLTSPSLREEASREGTLHSRQFTWKNAAEQSARFFEELPGPR